MVLGVQAGWGRGALHLAGSEPVGLRSGLMPWQVKGLSRPNTGRIESRVPKGPCDKDPAI